MGTWASRPCWTGPGSQLLRNPGARSVGKACAASWASEGSSLAVPASLKEVSAWRRQEEPEQHASYQHARL